MIQMTTPILSIAIMTTSAKSVPLKMQSTRKRKLQGILAMVEKTLMDKKKEYRYVLIEAFGVNVQPSLLKQWGLRTYHLKGEY